MATVYRAGTPIDMTAVDLMIDAYARAEMPEEARRWIRHAERVTTLLIRVDHLGGQEHILPDDAPDGQHWVISAV